MPVSLPIWSRRPFWVAVVWWEALVLVPLGILGVRNGARMGLSDVAPLAGIAAAGIVIVLFCSLLASRIRFAAAAIVAGLLVGVFGVVAPTYAWISLGLAGFENGIGVWITAAILALPSGVAGAIAGWLNRRRAA